MEVHPDQKEDFENTFYNILADGYCESSPYDYLVLFSGGKDSTYLAHKLKQAKGGRVCLFTVENGFEEKSYVEKVKKVASQLGADLFIYQPLQDELIEFYRFLITEDRLKEFDTNPLCFYCGRYFMALGMEFARRNNIPFVAYGATPMQLRKRKRADSLRDIEIFDMVSRKILMGNYKKIQAIEQYHTNPVIKKIFDKLFADHAPSKLIFPFHYLDYNIETIKQTLREAYGWQPPVEGLPMEKYLSSGCRMISLFGLLNKKRGFIPHELEQFEHDKDTMSGDAYEHNIAFLEEVMTGKITPEIRELAKLLGLEEELIEQGEQILQSI